MLSGVANNIPGLRQEMRLGRAAEKLARKRQNILDDAHPLRTDGPLVTKHILTFAAKFGFALHHEIYGGPIPEEGGVLVWWFSNVQAYHDQIPSLLFETVPAPVTLEQGTKTVADQFLYSYGCTDDGQHMLYFASFNQSFAVTGITAQDRTIFLNDHQNEHFTLFVPGSFRDHQP